MQKKFRKSIRIDGKLVSAEFTSKDSARAWYSQLHSKKVLGDFGLRSPSTKGGMLLKEFALGDFMQGRMANYPESTWGADAQRLRDHVLPALGNIPLSKLTAPVVRAFLVGLVEKKHLSPKTRDRIQALISVIYSDAINRPQPLVNNNPTFGLTFRQGKRKGVKQLSYLQTSAQCERYLKAARELGPLHYGVGCLGLMGGLRKQEMIAVRFGCADTETHTLEVCARYIQASGKIEAGTKSGEDSVRFVPMSEDLEDAIALLRQSSVRNGDSDFMLQYKDGSHLSPRTVFTLNEQTCARAEVECTVHGLRHTFGREFAQRSGNMLALKDIMGHSNFTTTQIYSQLGKDRLKGFRDVMNYGQRTTQNDND